MQRVAQAADAAADRKAVSMCGRTPRAKGRPSGIREIPARPTTRRPTRLKRSRRKPHEHAASADAVHNLNAAAGRGRRDWVSRPGAPCRRPSSSTRVWTSPARGPPALITYMRTDPRRTCRGMADRHGPGIHPAIASATSTSRRNRTFSLEQQGKLQEPLEAISPAPLRTRRPR